MAHIRAPLGVAVALNSGIFVVELLGGLGSRSLALLMDAVHNFSDELALICLWPAFVFAVSMSRGLQRTANLLNSLGLVAVSALLVWQAIDRVASPRPIVGWVPIVVGLVAAAGNWCVARVLRKWRRTNVAIGLAYLHNLGDTYVSLSAVVAGLLVSVLHRPIFDPLVALGVAGWIVVTTGVELRRTGLRLLWPSAAQCPHEELTAA